MALSFFFFSRKKFILYSEVCSVKEETTMGRIKDFMMDAYYKYKDGVSIEDIAKLYNVDVEFVKDAIETQKQLENLDEDFNEDRP